VQAADKPDVAARFADGKGTERVVRKAVRAALLRHKRLGESIAVWRDGQVVHVPPEEIPENGEIDPRDT
jgi:hypothetical protein